ncbi:MAG: KH domain-containing protein [Verrucomicrobiota bacterium]
MEEFLEYVIRQLIDYPDEMVLTRVDSARKIIFSLRLRQSDIGKVIGKHGHTIAAIRNLLGAAASRHGQRAVLQIVEEEGEAADPARTT